MRKGLFLHELGRKSSLIKEEHLNFLNQCGKDLQGRGQCFGPGTDRNGSNLGHFSSSRGVGRTGGVRRDGGRGGCKGKEENHWPRHTKRICLFSDSVKRHLRGCHLNVLNLKFDFISDGGCTREEQIALSLKRHLFPHGGREPKAFWICFSRVHPPSEIKSNFKFKTLKRHLLKRHLTLSDFSTNSLPKVGYFCEFGLVCLSLLAATP